MSAHLWTSLLYNEPLAISVLRNESLCRAAQFRLTGSLPERIDTAVLGMAPRATSEGAACYTENGLKPFAMKDGIAVIRAFGTLTKRGGFMDADSGLLGYDHLLRQMEAANRDPDVGGTFLLVDSPGGHTARMIETANAIAMMSAAEGGKPIYAYVDEQATSAAYVLASACDLIIGPRACMGGSLGVIMNMVDTSKLHEKMGIEPVIIRSSWADLKARPQPGEAIDEETISTMSAIVDEASAQLLEFVSAMREIPEQAIMDMRGEVFLAEKMISLGLLDQIATEREAWSMLQDRIG